MSLSSLIIKDGQKCNMFSIVLIIVERVYAQYITSIMPVFMIACDCSHSCDKFFRDNTNISGQVQSCSSASFQEFIFLLGFFDGI